MVIIYIVLKSGLCNRLIPLISLIRIINNYQTKGLCSCKYFICWSDKTGRSGLKFEGENVQLNELFQNKFDVCTFKTLNGVIQRYQGRNRHKMLLFNKQKGLKSFNALPKDFNKYEVIIIKDHVHPIGIYQDKKYLKSLQNYRDIETLNICNNKVLLELRYTIKTLIPTKEIQEKINQVYQKFKNKYVIGIHCRHTDQPWIPFNIDKVFLELDNLLYQTKNSVVFLATDNECVQDKFKTKYSQNLIIYENIISHKDISINRTSNKFSNDAFGAINGLVDIYLLSKCNVLLGNRGSSFSLCAWLLSDLKEYKIHSK